MACRAGHRISLGTIKEAANRAGPLFTIAMLLLIKDALYAIAGFISLYVLFVVVAVASSTIVAHQAYLTTPLPA
jgi:hypothetical protein